MDQTTSSQGITYHIRVRETLDRSASDWLGDVTLTPQQNGETLFIGAFTDQSALRGFMDRLWNLNFTVLYLERIESQKPK